MSRIGPGDYGLCGNMAEAVEGLSGGGRGSRGKKHELYLIHPKKYLTLPYD